MCIERSVLIVPSRPDCVAVLGELSMAEIEDYAARTHEIREAQSQPSLPLPMPRPWPSSITATGKNKATDPSKVGTAQGMEKGQENGEENVTATGLGGAAASLLQILATNP